MSDDAFISVDCETSGSYPGRHALLSIGAVAVLKLNGEWQQSSFFYEEWAPPDNAEEDKEASKVHGLNLNDLRLRGAIPKKGATNLATWTSKHSAKRRIFVGYNAAFDWAFVLHAFGQADIKNPFHHSPLDLKSAIWGVHGREWKQGSNVEALETALGKKIPRSEKLQLHNALDDAKYQAELLIALLQHLKA